MNRRDFLAAGFKLGAAGLLLPFIEPARKVWALDRTMVPVRSFTTEWFDMSMPDPNIIHVANTSIFEHGDIIYVGGEPMLVTGVFDTTTMRVIRNFGRP